MAEVSTERFDKLSERVEEIFSKVTDIATKVTLMEFRQNQMSKDVDEMKSKPAKRWDAIIAAIITGAVGIFLGLIVKTTVQ